MNRRSICMFALCLCLLWTLAACGGGDAPPEPLGDVPGYYAAGQVLNGGKGEDGIIAALTVSEHLDDTLIEVLTEGPLPAWSVECYPAPGRIALRITGCEPPRELPAAAALLKGAFDEDGAMIFQFTGEIVYKVEERDDGLVIRVRRGIALSDEWFVTLDGAADALPEGYAHVICADGVSVALLSPPYKTQEAATRARAALPGGAMAFARVIRVEDGKLPPSYEERETLYYSDHVNLVKGDITVEGRVWGVAMRFLNWSRDEDGGALVSKSVSDLRGNRDELWLVRQDSQQALLSHEWLRVTSAEYSDSGRFVAIVEEVDGMRLMYIYDTRDDVLSLLIEEGMGSYTASYTWDGDILYMMNGEDTLQLCRVDPSLPAGDPGRITAVREREELYSTIDASDGVLYYVDETASMIYSMDTVRYDAREMTEGEQFLLSPDGAYMAIFFYEPIEEDEDGEDGEDDGDDDGDTPEALMGQTGLKLRHLESGEETVISSGITLMGMAFSRDGSMLHYGLSDNTVEGAPCRLMTRKLGESASIEQGFLRTGEFYPGGDASTIVAVGYYRAEQAYRAVTFELKIIQ